MVHGDTARGNGDYGIYAYGDTVIENNLLISNAPSGAGIFISSNGSRIDGNSVTDSRWGIVLNNTATDNVVTPNLVRTGQATAHAMNDQMACNFPNNHVAQILTNPASPLATTNPLANIGH